MSSGEMDGAMAQNQPKRQNTRNDERPNMSYRNKGKRQDNADNQEPGKGGDPRMTKQVSNVSAGSIQSTNRFSAFGQ